VSAPRWCAASGFDQLGCDEERLAVTEVEYVGRRLPGDDVGHHVPETEEPGHDKHEHPHVFPEVTFFKGYFSSHGPLRSSTRLRSPMLCESTVIWTARALLARRRAMAWGAPLCGTWQIPLLAANALVARRTARTLRSTVARRKLQFHRPFHRHLLGRGVPGQIVIHRREEDLNRETRGRLSESPIRRNALLDALAP